MIKRRTEVSQELARDAKIAAESIGARLRLAVLPTLQDHVGKAKKAIAAESLDNLSASTHGVTNITVTVDLDEVDFLSPRRLAMRYDDMRSSEMGALRDSATELHGAAREIDELLQAHVPFIDFEGVVEGAQGSLTSDLEYPRACLTLLFLRL